MGSRPTKTPALPDAKDELAKALKETIEVREGRRGDPLDRFVTLRELQDANIVTTVNSRGARGGVGIGGPGNIPGDDIIEDGPPDYGDDNPTRPPAATGVEAAGIGENQIMVNFDPPIYTNHWYAEIYRIPKTYTRRAAPTVSEVLIEGFDQMRPVGPTNLNEFMVGTTFGSTFVDELPRTNLYNPLDPAGTIGKPNVDDALNPTPFWYWVRLVSRAQVGGPFHENPVKANRMINPTEVLDGLIAEVQDTQAFRNLRNWLGIGPGQLFQDVQGAGGLAGYTSQQAQLLTGKFNTLRVETIAGRSTVAEQTYWQAGLATYLGSTSVLHFDLQFYSANSTTCTVRIKARFESATDPRRNLLAQFITGSKLKFFTRTSGLSFLAGRTVTVNSVVTIDSETRDILFTRDFTFPESALITSSNPAAYTSFGTAAQDTAIFMPGSIDPNAGLTATVAAVAQDIMVDVRQNSSIAKLVNTVGIQIGQRIQLANSVINSVRADMTRMVNEYTIGLRQESDGIISATGVSLSLEGAVGSNQPARSAFIVSADQFAIMGSGSGASRMKGWEKLDANGAKATVANAAALASMLTTATANSRSLFVTFTLPGEYMATTEAPPVATTPTVTPLPATLPRAIDPLLTATPTELAAPSVEANARNVARANLITALEDVLANETNLRKFEKLTLKVTAVNVDTDVVTLVRDTVATGNAEIPATLSDMSDEFWREANVVMLPEQSMPFIVDTVRQVVGIRGTLVVDGLISARDVEVSNLLRANRIWTRTIVGEGARFETIVGQRIVAGNYPIPNAAGLPSNVANNTGQYIIALTNPGIVGSQGKPIRMYKPVFNSDGAETFGPGIGADAFFVQGDGSVFIGGNLTVRTDSGGANACSLVVGAKQRLNSDVADPSVRYALWIGPKSDIGAGLVSDDNAVFWVKEATVNGAAQAGFNANLFLNGVPFSQPMLASGYTKCYPNPLNTGSGDPTLYFYGNRSGSSRASNKGQRAVSKVLEVISDGWFDVRPKTNGDMPPVMVMANITAARMAAVSGKDDKRFILFMLVQHENGTHQMVASTEMDDYYPETFNTTLMGVVVPVWAGRHKVKVILQNMQTSGSYTAGSVISNPEDGFMSLLAGWTSFAQYVVNDPNITLGPSVAGTGAGSWSPQQTTTTNGIYGSETELGGTGGSGGGPGGGGGWTIEP